MKVRQESTWLPAANGESVHLCRVTADTAGPSVLLLHGMVENGRVFYSESNRGFAPFLARRGFDCWVLDLRGRGGSRPHVNRLSGWGQTDSLLEDLPTAIAHIEAERGRPAELWVAHSWGGVMLASYLVRFPEQARSVRRAVFFGTKRRVLTRTLERRLKVDLMWKLAASAIVAACGFLPARSLGWGSDDESRRSWADCVTWIREASPWIDMVDGFDYQTAARTQCLPRTLWITGAADRSLGHPDDVRLFMRECNDPDGDALHLARCGGYPRDAGHIGMLTHPAADNEHFPDIADWMSNGI